MPHAPATVEVGLLVARVTLDVAAPLTVGLSLLPLLIGAPGMADAEALLARTRPLAAAAAGIWSLAALGGRIRFRLLPLIRRRQATGPITWSRWSLR